MIRDPIHNLKPLPLDGLDEPQLALVVGVGRPDLDRHLGRDDVFGGLEHELEAGVDYLVGGFGVVVGSHAAHW